MSDLVKALGVKAREAEEFNDLTMVVSRDELQAALEKLPTVWGSHSDETFHYSGIKHPPTDTHKARLLCIEEIKREPLKVEFELSASENLDYKLTEFKGKRVRVTVEEI